MHFPPADEQSLKNRSHFVLFLFLVEPPKNVFCPKADKFSLNHFQFVFCPTVKLKISVVAVYSRKAKSPILSLENLRGFVRRTKPRKPANSVQPISREVKLERTVRQRFFSHRVGLYSFFTISPNDRGYGHLAVCGSIRCRGTTK